MSLSKIRWFEADQNPFGVRVLDLRPALDGLLSTTKDHANAERAMSWAASGPAGLDDAPVRGAAPIACALRYPAAAVLPDGLLFTPSCMEEKWVLAYRGGAILAARSWTGTVEAVASCRRDGDALVVFELRLAGESSLATYGDPVKIFDWLVRRHALDQALPLPADADGLAALERAPVAVFPAFGNRVSLAACAWAPPPPSRPLRSDGEVSRAVRLGDAARLRALIDAGEAVDAPTTLEGHTPLAIASIRGDLEAVGALLAAGADVNARSDTGQSALMRGIVHGAPRAVLDALVAAGADLRVVNCDGYNALHAAAENGNDEAIPWLLARGLELEARTGRDHTALHIACGLGHVDAARELLQAGADPQAPSPNGTAVAIARATGEAELIALVEAR